MNRFLCVIPARLHSTRFPKKVLHPLKGFPMVVHVYRRAKEARCCDDIVVATDAHEVLQVCRKHNIPALMTSDQHLSGFDRVVEVAQKENNFSHYLNLQGDEPAMPSENICSLVKLFENENVQIATSAVPFANWQDVANPNQVKVVMDAHQKALYFSRSAIPYFRQKPKDAIVYKHQGIYAYEKKTLELLAKLPPSPLELAESLEQLRFLYAGYSIHVAINQKDSVGIDRIEDVDLVLPFL